MLLITLLFSLPHYAEYWKGVQSLDLGQIHPPMFLLKQVIVLLLLFEAQWRRVLRLSLCPRRAPPSLRLKQMTQIKSKGVTKAYATLFIGLCARTCIYTLYMCNWFFLCLFIYFYMWLFLLSVFVYVTLIFYYILNHL